jgi:hypothetical protein
MPSKVNMLHCHIYLLNRNHIEGISSMENLSKNGVLTLTPTASLNNHCAQSVIRSMEKQLELFRNLSAESSIYIR